MEQRTCDERHERIDARLKEAEGKIDVLEKSDAKNTTKIDSLCDQLSKLTKAIWGLVVIVFSALIGFVFWYIQSGGKP